MNKRILAGILMLIFSGCSTSQLKFALGFYEGKVSDHFFVLDKSRGLKPGNVLEYSLLTFKPQYSGERFPLLFIFHGAGDNGLHYLENWEEEANRHRFMILAPTLMIKGSDQALDPSDFYRLLAELTRRYPVDKKRIYVEGASAGAFLARWLVEKTPSKWRAAVFVASPPLESTKKTDYPPMLFVHGTEDNQFPFESVQQMVEGLKQKGAKAELLSQGGAGHTHDPAWNKAIFDWIKKKT